LVFVFIQFVIITDKKYPIIGAGGGREVLISLIGGAKEIAVQACEKPF